MSGFALALTLWLAMQALAAVSALDPSPPDGGFGKTGLTLTWQAPAGASAPLGWRVYFGRDKQAVAQAGPASSLCKGVVKQAAFTPKAYLAEDIFYWRVDRLTPQGAVKGPVWSFIVTDALSRGTRVLMQRGIQLECWISQPSPPVNVQDWRDSFFTTPWSRPELLSALPDTQWAKWLNFAARKPPAPGFSFFKPWEKPYAHQLVSIQFGDEEQYSDQVVSNLAQWYDLAHAELGEVICHNNQWGGQWSQEQYRKYLETADADMLTYDGYFFNLSGLDNPGGSCQRMYYYLQWIRLPALAGRDGSGRKPLPFGQYMEGFRTNNGIDTGKYLVSQSQVNLYHFCAWTFGAKWVSLFRWLQNSAVGVLTRPDGSRTRVFDYYAEANRESRNLSYYLARLQNFAVRLVPGQHLDKAGKPAGNGIPGLLKEWKPGEDGFIERVQVFNLGQLNAKLPGDVVIGYFRPVLDFFDEPALQRQNLYFMVLNGLTWGDHTLPPEQKGTAHETRQGLLLTLKLDDYAAHHCYRVSRQTGKLELMHLESKGEGLYVLRDVLGGGVADLFIIERNRR